MKRFWRTKPVDEDVMKPFSIFGDNDEDAKFVYEKSAIFYAIETGDVNRTNQYLSKSVDVLHNYTVINAAIHSGNLDIIECFMIHNLYINGKSSEAETALHRAVLVCYPEDLKVEIVKLILRKGVCSYSRNKNGQTPLHLASQKGYAQLIETFLEYDPNKYRTKRNFEGNLIVQKGEWGYGDKAVHLNAQNNVGETALHMACVRNNQTIVMMLLNNGIDIDCQTVYGKTALDVAWENGCREAFMVLLRYDTNLDIDHLDETRKKSRRAEFITKNLFCNYQIEFHILKMFAAGRTEHEKNLKFVPDAEVLNSFRRRCDEEVGQMKKEKIQRHITYYDLLRKTSVNQLAVYTRDQKIVKALESRDWKYRYPIYSNMIFHNFKRGQVRERLINVGLSFFHSSIEFYLPLEVIIGIFGYVGNKHLINFIEACHI